MNLTNSKKTSKSIIICLVTVILLIPISYEKLRILGAILTPQRVFIPIIAIYIIAKDKLVIKVTNLRLAKKWFIFMMSWIIWGLILLVLSKYSPVKEGIKELFSLVIAILSSYIYIRLIQNRKDLDLVFRTIRTVIIFLVIHATIEILTGRHLSSSFYSNSIAMDSMYYSKGITPNFNMATTFYYGVNDFSSVLVFFSPILLLNERKHINKFINYVCLILIAVILVINDSNIALFGLIFGISYYFFKTKKYKSKKILKVVSCLIFITIVGILVLYFIELNLESLKLPSLAGKIETQVINYNNGYGSLFKRLTVYIDAVKASASNLFWGYGPKSFSRYFLFNKSDSGLVDPHFLGNEVLFNYGLIITLSYIIIITKIFLLNRKNYNKKGDKGSIIIMIMIVMYVVVSFSPSTFIGYQYQWILPALGVAILKIQNSSYYAYHNCTNNIVQCKKEC